MSGAGPGDEARVSMLVEVEPADAFRIFTEEIDQWWRHGRKFRAGERRSVVHLEPGVGGRLLESFEAPAGPRVLATGRVTVWEPPARLVLEWRAVNFGPEDPPTEVEVRFEPSPSGTLVRLCHRGWSRVRPDHPVRHGEASREFLRRLGLWWGDLMAALRERAARPA